MHGSEILLKYIHAYLLKIKYSSSLIAVVMIPTLCASAVAGSWWLFVLALHIRIATDLWIIVWLALFSPYIAVCIYAKLFYREEKNKDRIIGFTKSAFEATAEANM